MGHHIDQAKNWFEEQAEEIDRLRAENAALRERVAVLERVKDEAARAEKDALRAELMLLLARLRRGVAVTATEASMRLETLTAAKPAENGAGGA